MMDSHFGALALLCGLVLAGYVVETSCYPLPDDMEHHTVPKNVIALINELKEPLKDVKDVRTGGFFKTQIRNMQKNFNKTEQRLVVVEMLDLYSHILKNFTAGHGGQEGSAGQPGSNSVGEAAKRLQNHLEEMLNGYTDLHNSKKLLGQIHKIRDHKVADRKQQLEALNDLIHVYKQASDLSH